MFRLKEQQLHMLMWMMVAASALFFGVVGIDKALQIENQRSWKGMEDLSDGWIATYETSDEQKLEEYHLESVSAEQEEIPEEEQYTVLEVLTLPTELSVREDTSVVLTHLVPVMKQDPMYIAMELDNAQICVWVENQIIYSSGAKEQMVPVRHIIPLLPEYSNQMMTIEISNISDRTVDIQELQYGNYNQLWVSTMQADGVSAGMGCLLLLMGVLMLVAWGVIKNTWQQKRILLYGSMESVLLGAQCIFSGELIPLVLGWNYGTHILKACAIIIAIALHLTIIRCFIYKKKVLSIVDIGILLVGVLYISVMVLQVFGLIHFDTIYNIGIILYGLMVLLFTIVLAITIFDYQRREGMPIFVANVVLILCMLCQLIVYLAGRQTRMENVYICIGFLLYILYIGIYGLRQAVYIQPKKEEMPVDENEIRAEIVERMNPNLLFASFQTLQNLIKNGSEKSTKMIYYISVYFRDNLKALESADEVVSFHDELEHIIAYLQLQKTRNQNMDYAFECKVKEFNIPRHSLEPLVENAVKHGLAKNGNQGNVAIRTYTRADGYAIQIIDDGAGFDTNILKKKSTTIACKLALLESKCQARTEVISREGKGTVITIVLPMLENDLMEDME